MSNCLVFTFEQFKILVYDREASGIFETFTVEAKYMSPEDYLKCQEWLKTR